MSTGSKVAPKSFRSQELEKYEKATASLHKANNPHEIYKIYRKSPPTARRGVTVICAYWHGYDGTYDKFVRYSASWWANKAGKDNRKRDDKREANHAS
jgi:hypothetical protein